MEQDRQSVGDEDQNRRSVITDDARIFLKVHDKTNFSEGEPQVGLAGPLVDQEVGSSCE